MTIELKPLSVEDQLRREAHVNTPQSVIIQPEVEPTSNPNMAKGTINGSRIANKSEKLFPSVPNTSRLEILQLPGSGNVKTTFSIRLPVISYVLIWFYVATLAIISLITISYINFSNSVSFEYGYESLSSQFSNFVSGDSVFIPLLIAIVVCICLIFALLSGRKIFRYIAIVVSLAIVGYEIYLISKMFGSTSDVSESGSYSALSSIIGLLATVMYASYLPFALVPIATLIFLLTPKARRAYK